jgi:hypothetical protein
LRIGETNGFFLGPPLGFAVAVVVVAGPRFMPLVLAGVVALLEGAGASTGGSGSAATSAGFGVSAAIGAAVGVGVGRG